MLYVKCGNIVRYYVKKTNPETRTFTIEEEKDAAELQTYPCNTLIAVSMMYASKTIYPINETTWKFYDDAYEIYADAIDDESFILVPKNKLEIPKKTDLPL